jgi:hypothetical protein
VIEAVWSHFPPLNAEEPIWLPPEEQLTIPGPCGETEMLASTCAPYKEVAGASTTLVVVGILTGEHGWTG